MQQNSIFGSIPVCILLYLGTMFYRLQITIPRCWSTHYESIHCTAHNNNIAFQVQVKFYSSLTHPQLNLSYMYPNRSLSASRIILVLQICAANKRTCFAFVPLRPGSQWLTPSHLPAACSEETHQAAYISSKQHGLCTAFLKQKNTLTDVMETTATTSHWLMGQTCLIIFVFPCLSGKMPKRQLHAGEII